MRSSTASVSKIAISVVSGGDGYDDPAAFLQRTMVLFFQFGEERKNFSALESGRKGKGKVSSEGERKKKDERLG
ncbi:hypothetical protein V6N11_077258 [Hibiscus sabdariffa]|uniref:Uncharacterized protein n=1 Tax=Hibiscus sabdariffa TaxID=183260 RepID=A0ABR2TD48_9ROSI